MPGPLTLVDGFDKIINGFYLSESAIAFEDKIHDAADAQQIGRRSDGFEGESDHPFAAEVVKVSDRPTAQLDLVDPLVVVVQLAVDRPVGESALLSRPVQHHRLSNPPILA